MHSVIENLKLDFQDQLNFLSIDVDENPALIEVFSIKNVPSFLLFDNDVLLWRQSGLVTKSELQEVISQYLT